jgi:membrane carboxypeptidase/penicillin-binding protein
MQVRRVHPHTVAVWIGSDTVASLGDKETGAKAALPAWLQIV